MLKSFNTELFKEKTAQNRQNFDILNRRSNSQKFASFEGTYFHLTTLFYNNLDKKKASVWMPFFRNSRKIKGRFLVKSEEN